MQIVNYCADVQSKQTYGNDSIKSIIVVAFKMLEPSIQWICEIDLHSAHIKRIRLCTTIKDNPWCALISSLSFSGISRPQWWQKSSSQYEEEETVFFCISIYSGVAFWKNDKT